MNGPFQHTEASALPTLSPELEILAPPPLLLPGESLEHYQLLRQAILAEIAPRSAIEWLLAIDVAELCWDIHRYGLLRHKLLDIYRQQAIERALSHIDHAGIVPELMAEAVYHTRLNALAWRSNDSAANEIEARLADYGFDQHAINTEVHAQARDLYMMFEALIASAQSRRAMLLKELGSRRPNSTPGKRAET